MKQLFCGNLKHKQNMSESMDKPCLLVSFQEQCCTDCGTRYPLRHYLLNEAQSKQFQHQQKQTETSSMPQCKAWNHIDCCTWVPITQAMYDELCNIKWDPDVFEDHFVFDANEILIE